MNKPNDKDILPQGVLLCQQSIDVRWGDMDALGHVNNTVYFRFFEQVRIAWFESAGFGSLGLEENGMVIVDAHAEFLRPIVYPARIEARMGGHSPGRSSFVSTYTLSVDGELYTRGHSKVVWIDPEAGRSVPLPTVVRDALGESDV